MKSLALKFYVALYLMFGYQEQVKHLHPFLNFLYPVSVIEKDHFNLFDLDSSGTQCVFMTKTPVGIDVPERILTDFNLNLYDNWMVAVVKGKLE